MEQCENCERKIGNLETPFVWGERTVCEECHRRLSVVGDPSQLPIAIPVAYATPYVGGDGHVQVIERTSKIFKGQILVATLLFAGGVIVAASPFLQAGRMAGDGPIVMILGLGVAGIAAVWLAVVRFLIWWNHA